jgi:aspartyl-tRNA(Asn)/glutamyl-tRNA(Gln) amidotransferase subunit A
MQPYELSVEATVTALSRRELSATETIESVLARVDEIDGGVGAFVHLDVERARSVARAADDRAAAGGLLGRLHGVPISLKDLYDQEGVVTGGGSDARVGHIATASSVVAQRLEDAGAILIGKVRTHEFAYGATTPGTRNPWTLRHVPGGSSGGSAAAVSAGMGMASMGTDTGGSIRGPAALCGVVGLKPTYGLVPLRGIVPLSWSMDHAGPLARSVRDAAILTSVVAGGDAADLSTATRPVANLLDGIDNGVTGLTVGVPRSLFFEHCHPEVDALVRSAIATLEQQGARLVEVDVPMADLIAPVHYLIMAAEASAYHRRGMRDSGHLYGPETLLALQAGHTILAGDYIDALRTRVQIVQKWHDLFSRIDVLVAPSLPVPASPYGLGEVTYPDGSTETLVDGHARNAFPADLTGFPALSVPCGTTSAGLPVGLQMVGRPFDEATVLRAGRAYEVTSGWAGTIAPLS